MKIVIAPDSFKESLPAGQVAEAIARGVLAACEDAQVDLCPMADGGEGTVEAMVAATGGRFVSADVFDPLGREVRARFGLLGRGSDAGMLPGDVGLAAASVEVRGEAPRAGSRTAVLEMAAASGLALVPLDRRDPLRATTYGTGEMILAALQEGAGRILLGIGGSATVDGGAGAVQALGVRFFDADGRECRIGMGGGDLAEVARIDTTRLDPRLADVDIRVACDVTNPLTGPEGAARVYGPQKGATDEQVEQLEANLARYAGLIREQLGQDLAETPGAGAAGGLGYGLMAFAGATLENGGKLIARSVGLEQRLAGADLCITGEGKVDAQTRYGKVAARVCNLAGQHGVPTVCIAGLVTDDAPRELFRELRALVGGDVTLDEAMDRPAELLAERAEAVMRAFCKNCGS